MANPHVEEFQIAANGTWLHFKLEHVQLFLF